MSTPTRHAPTRRTVLRAAAWTAPAVSIAVAAPAFAASPIAIKGSGSSDSINRIVGKNPQVIWTITFYNTGTVAMVKPLVTFSGVTSVTSLAVTGGAGWTGTSLNSRTYAGSIAAGGSVTLTATFDRSDSASGNATASLTAAPTFSGAIQAAAAYN